MMPSDAALTLLKQFEQGPKGGFAAVAYRCPAGKQTVGWGHVIRPNERIQTPFSEADAEQLLLKDLDRVWPAVRAAVRVPVTQAMFDALVCFAFNVGIGAFLGSTLLARLNSGDYAGASDQFLRWNKARDPQSGLMRALAGLTKRRNAERALFLREGTL